MRRVLVAFGLFVALAAGFNLWAQTEASITGTITDSSEASIPGAKVTATNEGTHGMRVVESDNAGVYDIPALVPGLYTVSVEVKGFQTAVTKGVELQVQQARRLNFTMQVGQVTQVIEVAGSAIALNTENATVGSVIENERIVDLPLDGRNFLSLTALDANVMYGYSPDVGAATSRMGGTRNNEDISVAGGRPEFDYYSIDGISNTDVSFNTYTFLPSIDAIQEFRDPNRRLPGGIRPRDGPNQRFHEGRHQHPPRVPLRIRAKFFYGRPSLLLQLRGDLPSRKHPAPKPVWRCGGGAGVHPQSVRWPEQGLLYVQLRRLPVKRSLAPSGYCDDPSAAPRGLYGCGWGLPYAL